MSTRESDSQRVPGTQDVGPPLIGHGAETYPFSKTRALPFTGLVLLGLVVFSALFVLLDQAYYRLVAAHFPSVGTSARLATQWGILSRAPIIALVLPLVLWRPKFVGFQTGQIAQHRRLLLAMLLVNCSVVAAYLALTGSGTPYSGNEWLLTEIVTVPLLEETVWRGLVFSVLLALFGRVLAGGRATHLAAWSSGIAFGLLHLANAFAGVPLAFVAIQSLSAAVWGVMYGYARARTESVYPPILLHAAMNLIVVLFV